MFFGPLDGSFSCLIGKLAVRQRAQLRPFKEEDFVMSETTPKTGSASAGATVNSEALVEINTIGVDSLIESLADGVRDFRAAPSYGLLFGLAFAAVGWLFLALLWYFDLPFFAYPLAMGFALCAPFFAGGLYEVSRRLGAGEALSWSGIFGALFTEDKRDLRWMALVAGFALVLWMDIAAFLFFGFLGFQDFTSSFLTDLFTTPSGLLFLLIGNLAGAFIATVVFSISVISFPMLFDRNIDFVTAMVTSVKAVQKNPMVMLLWALIIAGLLGLCLLSAFAGLIIILPVLGHATWHLYKRVVSSADVPA